MTYTKGLACVAKSVFHSAAHYRPQTHAIVTNAASNPGIIGHPSM